LEGVQGASGEKMKALTGLNISSAQKTKKKKRKEGKKRRYVPKTKVQTTRRRGQGEPKKVKE